MKTRFVVGEQPKEAPEGWIIQNAPRPLYGHETWEGDFICGVFFAAINPDMENCDNLKTFNEENGAVVLQFVSEETAVQEGFDYYAEKFPKIFKEVCLDLNDPETREKMIRGWLNHVNKPETA
ncbi:hypothetical protein ACFLXQ_01525 [Chloroflexota bacterium]